MLKLIHFIIAFLFITVCGNVLTVLAQGDKYRANQSAFLDGIIRTVISEDDKGTRKYFLDTSKQFFAIALENEESLNARVSVTGKFNSENTIIPEKIKVAGAANDVSNIPVSGSRKVLALLLNFQNNTTQPVSAAEVKNKIFTDVKSPNQYYQQRGTDCD